jgi:hypothetical protein
METHFIAQHVSSGKYRIHDNTVCEGFDCSYKPHEGELITDRCILARLNYGYNMSDWRVVKVFSEHEQALLRRLKEMDKERPSPYRESFLWLIDKIISHVTQVHA